MKLKSRVKTVVFFIILTGVTCLFLFMNCSLSEDFEGPSVDKEVDTESDDDGDVHTDPNPPGGFPDPDNPKNKDNIKWLHGNTDISEWNKTSKITPPDIEIKVQNGQVCITHSKQGQWPSKSAQARLDPIVTKPVEGNPWIIVPIKGKGYAATYDWLRAGEPCHMLDVENLQNLYSSDKSLGKRTHKSPLTRWIAVPGDKIGLMVSGLARNQVRNVQARSNMLVVTLPDENGDIPPDVEEPCSQDPNSSLCKECLVPNRITIIKNIVEKYGEASAKAYELRTDYIADGPDTISSDDPRWEFMDRVVSRLHKMDERWGYTCIRKNCADIATDTIAYACGQGQPSESSSIFTVNIIGENRTFGWNIVNDPNPKEEDVEDTEDADDARDLGDHGGDEGDNEGEGTGNPSGPGQADPGSQGSRAIAMSTDTEDDPGPGWLYPRPGAKEYGCVPPEGAPNPARQLELVKRVADKFGDLYEIDVKEGDRYKIDVEEIDVKKFTTHVAECLREKDSKWGLREADSGFPSKNIVAYNTGNPPYSVSIVRETGELQWAVQESPSGGDCGYIGGIWQATQGECILEDVDGDEPLCPKELFDAETHQTVKGKCLPNCITFQKTNVEGVDIGIGDLCDDTTNYNILEIEGTVEGSGDSPLKCCRRSSKINCPTGYKLKNRICLPRCRQAAKLKGYTDEAGGGDEGTGNWVLHEKQTFANDAQCKELDEYGPDGYNDWEDFEFYDPYNFKKSTNKTNNQGGIYFQNNDYLCCVRDSQDAQIRQPYDLKGWHPDDKIDGVHYPSSNDNTPSSTTTTTTSECQSDSDCEGSGTMTCVLGQCLTSH